MAATELERVEIEGLVDGRGFLGDASVAPGFSEVRGLVTIGNSASERVSHGCTRRSTGPARYSTISAAGTGLPRTAQRGVTDGAVDP